MRFLIDMPLSPQLAHWLQAEGYDAVHASDLSLQQSPDAEIMRIATRDDRIIITADLDFPRLLAMFGASGPGLILLRGGNYSEAESLVHPSCPRVRPRGSNGPLHRRRRSRENSAPLASGVKSASPPSTCRKKSCARG